MEVIKHVTRFSLVS